MSTDGYQRVARIVQDRASSSGDQLLRVYEHGPLKVVPADAIVIERGHLPAVAEHRGPLGVYYRASARDGMGSTVSLDGAEDPRGHARARALEFLALAEDLDANPPVDEARVRSLADALLGDAPYNGAMRDDAMRMAERAIRTGWAEGDK